MRRDDGKDEDEDEDVVSGEDEDEVEVLHPEEQWTTEVPQDRKKGAAQSDRSFKVPPVPRWCLDAASKVLPLTNDALKAYLRTLQQEADASHVVGARDAHRRHSLLLHKIGLATDLEAEQAASLESASGGAAVVGPYSGAVHRIAAVRHAAGIEDDSHGEAAYDGSDQAHLASDATLF